MVVQSIRTALWRKYIFAGEKSGPNERSVSGGNQNRRTHFRARRRIKRKYRRPKPMLRFDGAFRSCQTTEMTPAVLIHHRVSLLTCVRRVSLSASVSLPSHRDISPQWRTFVQRMTALGRTHAHSTVRVGIPACFIFGCFLTFMGLCGIAAAR